MSSKQQTIFLCSSCDAQFPKWQGRCTECGSWGTVEAAAHTKIEKSNSAPPGKTARISDMPPDSVRRITTGIEEFDRVLGGGIVPSSLVLIGGEPGIGKSTLILQVACAIKKNTLYVSGEESGSQIKMRAERLNLNAGSLNFFGETHIETICSTIEKEKPELTIIDSIQTVYSSDVPSEPGSMSQIRSATVRLLEIAKKTNTAIFIIGHITKEGVVAGPKMLEHLVDTVVYLEGDRYHSYRIMRTIKNRFGSTNEVGVFEMKDSGLAEVKNPSAIFLMDKNSKNSGSIITATLEGSRIFLAEVQALVTKTSFGYPQRKAQGFDLNRLNLLIAVLQRRAHIALETHDIHVNITGGLKVSEPAIDLAVCLAVVSAIKNIILDARLIAFGEVGLGGEVRAVNQTEKRVLDCAKLGFKKIIMPQLGSQIKTSCEIVECENIQKAIEYISNTKQSIS